MALFQTSPPYKLHAADFVDQREALHFVSSYLEAAEIDASLHPNALLTENGPVTLNPSTSFGLVLHNLKRVEAGLEGQHLEAELDVAGSKDSELTNAENNDAIILGNQMVTEVAPDDDWQDKEIFEREQEEEHGEIGPQITATREGLSDGGQAAKESNVMTRAEKEARKQRKKEKRLKEKRERAEKNKREKIVDV